MAVKILIYWLTKDEEAIAAIRKHFNIPKYVTLNGWNPAEIEKADMAMFEETAKRGFFRFRRVDWYFNGTTYSW